jgi:glycosyltransferase involved in cell wall biosynthesis
MKILSITGGAARMYCGSCMKDNALAAELKRQGHDVILLPLYTPTRTDEPNVSHGRVFFGGISVYLQERSSLFRKMPRLVDKLLDAPAVINAFAGRGVSVDPAALGAMTVSMLEGVDGHQRKEIDKLLEWLKSETPPEVTSLPYTLLISLARPIRQATGRPVVCVLQGEELFLEALPEPYRSRSLELIRRQVDEVDAFIAVSHYCARFMKSYLRIPDHKMFTVPLGINLEGHGLEGRTQSEVFTIGYFARIAPEKGLHLLADAYRALRSRPGIPPTRLEAAGYLAPEHRGYLASVEQKLKGWGLAADFRYRGEVDRDAKLRFLKSIDLLSVPCSYDEPKGLFVLEAMANGTPVVQPRHGAFPELIESTGGGLLVEPGSAEALADGFERLIRDRALAASLGAAGHDAVCRNYSIARMAERTVEAYSAVSRAGFSLSNS